MGRASSTRYNEGGRTRLGEVARPDQGRSRLAQGCLEHPRAPAHKVAAAIVTVGVSGLLWCAWRRLGRVAVTGESMAPLLRSGDHVLVWKTRAVRPGDVVAAPDPRQAGRTLLKRAVQVEGGRVWLEGDNREGSTDSRHFGPVALSSVQGRAVYRYFPPDRAGRL